jgi:D-inositol-3-phosphate glycosyltransferase
VASDYHYSMAVRNIAVLAYHSSPLSEPGAGDAGGMTVYVRALAAALAELGIRTDLFTRATSDIGRMVHLGDGVRVISIEAGPPRPLAKEELPHYIDDFVSGIRAFATSQRIRYDLVHSHYWQSGLAALELAERWAVPLVHSHHTLGRVKNEWLAPGDAPEPASRLEGEAEVISQAEVLVASTDEEWEQLACLYSASHDRLKTLHPGVDHQIFSPGNKLEARTELGLPEDAAVLLYVGRIQRLKGLDLGLQALAELEGRLDRPVVLVVVGGASGNNGGDELLRLQGMAESLGVADQIRWMGPQPHPGLVSYYRAADVLLVCSHSESFGLTALEAHACGTPVVATAVGGLSHIVADGQSGWLVSARDPVVFAERLERLLDDSELIKLFGVNAVSRASAFSWDVVADEFRELYECLVREEFPEACTC